MICLLNCQGEKRKLKSPDPEIDAFMKATAMEGQETSLVIDYVIKLRGLPVQRQINHILREVLDVERCDFVPMSMKIIGYQHPRWLWHKVSPLQNYTFPGGSFPIQVVG
ncbi:hypothetical protein Droror1_Dr00020190 [Drosera rotundifolia]